MTTPSARLRVLRPETSEASEPKQDCGTCAKRINCWAQGIKEEHIVLNLLVCRLKRGIEINRTTKLILQMLQPKLHVLATRAIRNTNIDLSTALADLESATIQCLQHQYIMG